jgi:patatin-like phospholipase/acyl hydrolase
MSDNSSGSNQSRKRSSQKARSNGRVSGATGQPSSGDRDVFQVLALHGGGIHGVATAAYLADLEEYSESHIRDHFDLLVGTSTGGIIALALSLGIPAREVETLYRENGEEIFRRRVPFVPTGMAKYLWAPYDQEPLCELLRETLGPETRLKDAECRLCIPAVNITTGRNEVFKTPHRDIYTRDPERKMWRVGAATAAAPPYFSPVKIPDRGWYVDGGLWANAPIEVGIAEGRKIGHSLDEVEVLSVGTGQEEYSREGGPHWLFQNGRHGVIGWGSSLVDLVMRSQSQRSQDLGHYLLSNDQVVHVDFPLPSDVGGLDAVGEVDVLADRARSEAKQNGSAVRDQFFVSEASPTEANQS